jgi:hypothetical protein
VRLGWAALLLTASWALRPADSLGQELTPRAYWPAPKGTKVVVVGYSYATGDVLFDPSVPLYGVDSVLNAGVLAYLQTFSLWGRTANVVAELPYTWGTTRGTVVEDPARQAYSGFSDLGVTLSVNLLGAPTLTPADFQELRAHPRPILGASLKVVAPTGRYDPARLINEGANRWATKAELGFMVPLRPRWLLELEAGVWLFGDDDEFVAGRKVQDPIFAADFHLVRRFKPGFWAALDLNYFTGGRQTIGANRLGDVQRNSRIGGTVVVPFGGRHAVKVGYALGVFTEFGTDFDQLLVSYQVVFR